MIIGISGKIGSGKDTVGKIIQYLTISNYENVKHILKDRNGKDVSIEEHFNSFIARDYKVQWQIKKFADKLKDIVCLLLGCDREQLENETFKNSELGEEWDCYEVYFDAGMDEKELCLTAIYNSYEEALEHKTDLELFHIKKRKTTPRLLLQLLGTECGREIIHPNIWVNSLMSEYKEYNYADSVSGTNEVKKLYKYPNWIITDTRFPNELEAVKKRGGITIRVERPFYYNLMEDGVHEFFDKLDKTGYVYRVNASYSKEEAEKLFREIFNDKVHESETALDSAEFDYVINNNGTIEELIEEVKQILIKENLL